MFILSMFRGWIVHCELDKGSPDADVWTDANLVGETPAESRPVGQRRSAAALLHGYEMLLRRPREL
jgi:hypothetical protein